MELVFRQHAEAPATGPAARRARRDVPRAGATRPSAFSPPTAFRGPRSQIARESGVSIGTIYRVFPRRKDGIYPRDPGEPRTTLLGRTRAIGEAAWRQRGDLLDAMLAGVVVTVDFFAAHPDFLRLVLREEKGWAGSAKRSSTEQTAMWREGVEGIVSAMRFGIAEGLLVDDDPETMARAWVAIQEAHLGAWLEQGMQATPAEVAARFQRRIPARAVLATRRMPEVTMTPEPQAMTPPHVAPTPKAARATERRNPDERLSIGPDHRYCLDAHRNRDAGGREAPPPQACARLPDADEVVRGRAVERPRRVRAQGHAQPAADGHQGVELIATPGTHHFVVWNYLGQDQNPADFWTGIAYATACTGLGPQDGSLDTTGNLSGMLSGRSRFQFPAGVAVRLEPHANVYANLHYHNYEDTTTHTDAVFNFIPARKGTVKHHAQTFTVGTTESTSRPMAAHP